MVEALTWLLLALLAAGPVLVLLALLLPWHLEVTGGTAPEPNGRILLRPGASRGPVLARLAWPRARRARARSKEKSKDSVERRPRDSRTAKRHAERRRRVSTSLLRSLPDLIGRTLRGVEVISLSLHGRFGLADPADTGMLWGRLCPVLWASPALGDAVSLEPDFHGERLEGEGAVMLRLWPLWLIGPALRFALTEGRRAWFAT